MKHIYKIENGVVVPDGTTVYEIIGPVQSALDKLPIVEEQSLALGELKPGEKSNVHIHPIISHLTYVLSGTLTVGMKDKRVEEMYYLEVKPNETVLTEPGTFFQLLNNGTEPCRVLYIVAPAFVFEVVDDQILYNDQIVLGNDWEAIKNNNWDVPEMHDMDKIRKDRQASIERLRAQA